MSALENDFFHSDWMQSLSCVFETNNNVNNTRKAAIELVSWTSSLQPSSANLIVSEIKASGILPVGELKMQEFMGMPNDKKIVSIALADLKRDKKLSSDIAIVLGQYALLGSMPPSKNIHNIIQSGYKRVRDAGGMTKLASFIGLSNSVA